MNEQDKPYEPEDLDHPIFQERLRLSEEARLALAKWLLHRGNDVWLPHHSVAPTRNEQKEHSDNGDIYITQRLESKGRLNITFTCRRDYPYRDVLVCACHSYDNARPKPFAFVILNREKTYAAVVMTSTFESWTVRQHRDPGYHNVVQNFYHAPLDKVAFLIMPNGAELQDDAA